MPAIPRSQFAAEYSLPDWRIILHTLRSTFRTPSFSAATSFASDIATFADELNHHPDIDIRLPGDVAVTLTTHTVSGLTSLDAQLAKRISDHALACGFQSHPASASGFEIAIDAMNIQTVLPFWRASLGYADGPPDENGIVSDLFDPAMTRPTIWFQQMDSSRPQRNRVHFDVIVPHDEAEQRVSAAVAAGGTLLTDQYAPAFWVLADPEGNEACICTWQGRD